MPTSHRALWFLTLLTLGWTGVVLGAVAVVQRPDALRNLPWLLQVTAQDAHLTRAGLLRVGRSLGAGTLVATSALALGQAVLGALRLPRPRSMVAAGLVGLGTLGTLAWAVAAVMVPSAWVVGLLLTLPLSYWLYERPRWTWPPVPRPVAAVVAGFLLLSLGRALLPDLSWDGRFYHLVVPATWIEAGRAVTWQTGPHFHFPHLGEGLFLLTLLLGDGESGAAVAHWLFFPLVLALVWALAAGEDAPTRGGLALLLAASIPMLPLLAGWAYTDVMLAAFTLGTLWALGRWRRDGGAWVAVAGALAGFALGVKYTAFPVPLIGLGLLAGWRTRRPRPWITFVGAVGLAGGVWYLRNGLETGNPVYPFLLGGPAWDTFRATWYHAGGTGVGREMGTWLLVPLLTTLGIRDANLYDGQMGPLFLGFAPLALGLLARAWRARRPLPRTFALLLPAAGALVTLWLIGIADSRALWQSRFLLPPLLLLCPVVAWALEELRMLDRARFTVSFLARALVGFWCVLALGFGGVEWLSHRPLLALGGSQPPEEWLALNLGEHPTALSHLASLPANARVLLLYEPRSLGAARPTQPDAILDEFAWRHHRARGDGEQVAATMQADGYTHLLVSRIGMDNARQYIPDQHPPALLDALDAMLHQHASHLWTSARGEYELYTLR